MDRVLPTVGILAVLILVAALAVAGWRRRVRRDASAGAGYPAPQARSAPLAAAEVLYVATTRAGEPLERLALPGLAFRARGEMSVSAEGIDLSLRGEDPVFIPAPALTGAGEATVTIDRVVERDGLVRLGWTTSGGASADSYFRVIDPAGRGPLTAAIHAILPAAAQAAGDTTESEV